MHCIQCSLHSATYITDGLFCVLHSVGSVMKGIHLSDDQTSAYVSGTSRNLKWNMDEEINCYCSNLCPIQPVDDVS